MKDNKDDSLTRYGGIHPDYSQVIDYFNKGKIYSIQIEANLSCKQGCIYCYASADTSIICEMPRIDIEKIIKSASKMGVKAIDWLGGDPLLRKDWYNLMKLANKFGLINNIWTSGILLENIEVAQKAVEVTKDGFISVHLDTLDLELYKKLHTRDAKTKINAILKGVDNVQKLGKNPNHMMNCITFTKPIAIDAEKTIKIFYEKKGMRTCLTQICSEGLAKDKKYLIPSIAEIKRICKFRDSINYPDSKLSIASMDVNKYYCGGMVCITVDGDVTPCSIIRKGFGNIHNSSFEKIVKDNINELLFLHFREPKNMSGHCSICENNLICWGCRATAYSKSGDIFGIDLNCFVK